MDQTIYPLQNFAVCDPAAIGPAVSAIGGAAQASANNKHKRKMYAHQLKVRERKWMQTRSTYQSKKVQFEQEVDLANIAAQRAYSRTQTQLNRARSMAILQNQDDFKKMLSNEGMIEASAAERGVRGKSFARQLVMNQGNFGLGQAMRSRALATAGFDAKDAMAETNRQLKGTLNRSFSKVAISPVPDFAPPAPQMENPGLILMMGMANAVSAGIGGMDGKTMGDIPGGGNYSITGGASIPNVSGGMKTGTYGSFMPSNPTYVGAGANINLYK